MVITKEIELVAERLYELFSNEREDELHDIYSFYDWDGLPMNHKLRFYREAEGILKIIERSTDE